MNPIEIAFRELDRREPAGSNQQAKLGDRLVENVLAQHAQRPRRARSGVKTKAIGLPGGSLNPRIASSCSASDFS